MDCPFCLNDSSKVTNKRKSPEGIRRRRECLKCKRRFTTYERFEQTDLWVIKKNGERERFDRDKLEKGVMKAFEKRDIQKEKIEQMITKIEDQIRRKGGEVKSSVIGSLVMKSIKKLDNVASALHWILEMLFVALLVIMRSKSMTSVAQNTKERLANATKYKITTKPNGAPSRANISSHRLWRW